MFLNSLRNLGTAREANYHLGCHKVGGILNESYKVIHLSLINLKAGVRFKLFINNLKR